MSAAPPLLLASTSPRRADLLRQAGYAFEQLDPGVDDRAEDELLAAGRRAGLTPAELALRLALAKLLSALRLRPARARAVAADTFVVDGERILGKPRDLAHAREILASLRGRSHRLLTGVALLDDAGVLRLETAESQVVMQDYDDRTLEGYLAGGAWQGKAGGYGLQDVESQALVARVVGSSSNVKGLPLEVVEARLARQDPSGSKPRE